MGLLPQSRLSGSSLLPQRGSEDLHREEQYRRLRQPHLRHLQGDKKATKKSEQCSYRGMSFSYLPISSLLIIWFSLR